MSRLMIKGNQASGIYGNATQVKINEIEGMTAANTQEALVALNNSLTQLIKTKEFNHNPITITKSEGTEAFEEIGIDGYTPIAVYVNGVSHAFIVPVSCHITSISRAIVRYANTYGADFQGTIRIAVVYAKSDSVTSL